ncbi:c-type cytochrome biogenesis protein CcmI [Sulfitobacter aestuariivivens]|uniref:C-type cytochrome biogenesis protein CcmI n=1 Tax=Sulfitobacter aestuariivivens TaxID=2766981 RepID=A0A927D100_9RHOB|nr:c-type cytochrome biogenesis protein CcmI [Sulfitobacter aestuariivivens]MBD3662436.1 c-type cytochrome biogenesis protein CcmI [Sulfitobacter aestuariivivens]
MSFWIITIAMAAIVTLLLARALWRGADSALPGAAELDMQVYRDQLAEVDRDVARGVVPHEDAKRVRTEISRRILSADAKASDDSPSDTGPRPVALVLLVALLGAGSLGLYAWLGQPGYGDLALEDRIAFAQQVRETRPSQQAAIDSLPAPTEAAQIEPRYARLLEQLRATVAERPDDLQGHVLLAENEANVGNFAAAARAQETVLRIKGAEVTPKDLGDYGELLVLSAGGYVSPEAEVALRAVLEETPTDGRARYYLGLMMAQTGRPDLAFRIWDELLRRGDPDAAWNDPIRAQIMAVAQLAGVDYTLPRAGTRAAAGPSADDIEAAGDMTPEERMDMIGGMVAGLSDRLATDGGPPEDWARLITSLGVLGQRGQARAIYDNAMQVFADSPSAVDIIRRAGQQAGVAE